MRVGAVCVPAPPSCAPEAVLPPQYSPANNTVASDGRVRFAVEELKVATVDALPWMALAGVPSTSYHVMVELFAVVHPVGHVVTWLETKEMFPSVFMLNRLAKARAASAARGLTTATRRDAKIASRQPIATDRFNLPTTLTGIRSVAGDRN